MSATVRDAFTSTILDSMRLQVVLMDGSVLVPDVEWILARQPYRMAPRLLTLSEWLADDERRGLRTDPLHRDPAMARMDASPTGKRLTMVDQAIDFSYARPTPKAILNAGYRGVLRYISHTASKNLTLSEYMMYRNAGIGVAVVFEDAAGQALQGYAQGLADAQFANRYADQIQFPKSAPIFYAVDTQILGPNAHQVVLQYFNGARAAGGREVRGYGQASVCDLLASNGYGHNHWQTMAWSGGTVSQHAGILQTVTPPKIPDTDINNILKPDWGQDNYTRGTSTMPLTGSDADVVANSHVIQRKDKDPLGNALWSIGTLLSVIYADTQYLRDELDTVKTAVAAIPTTGGTGPGGTLTIADVKQAIAEVLATAHA